MNEDIRLDGAAKTMAVPQDEASLNEDSVQRPMRGTAIARAVRLHCPNCGRSRLFSSYIKPVEACAACGERYGHIRSDDAAPWLTILIVGHVLVPIMVFVQSADLLTIGTAIFFWPATAAGMMAFILPRAKALMIAVIWFEKSPGSEIDDKKYVDGGPESA